MTLTLVSDELWEEIKPLIPRVRANPKGGRPRVSDRACLTGIVFVMRMWIPWRMLPPAMGYGSGVTCWRRLCEWDKAGVWSLIYDKLRSALGDLGGPEVSSPFSDPTRLIAALKKALGG